MPKKRDFTNIEKPKLAAAEAFITKEEPAPAAGAIPKGYMLVKERKTARMHILTKPSTKETLKEVAEKKGTSVNDLVNDMIEAALDTMGEL